MSSKRYKKLPEKTRDLQSESVNKLIPILKNARDSKHEGQILIHIKTKKGKGYTFAEEAKDNYHGS